MWLGAGAVVDDSVNTSSPADTESTVVWFNGATQCDSTLQLNILVTINNIWWFVDNTDYSCENYR